MMRFTVCSGGLLAEVLALNSSTGPVAMSAAFLSLVVSAALWWPVYRKFVDQVVGFDL